MAKKGAAGGDGGGSKKAQGQARKADAAASKQAAKNQQAEKAEAEEWNKGAKSNAKAEAAAEKAAEAARKKAEKEALLREEEASLPSKPKGKNPKAEKKPRGGGIDSALGSFDAKPGALNATGIDNALDALDITGNSQDKVDRHPERRFKAAYAAFEERRLDEMKDEKGLRRQQKIDQIRKEFEKHPENPFNQVNASYNMTREEIAALRESEKEKKEKRLVGVN
ncbi:uncharacterized protein J4E88_003747 [Alternaria novae-zelandiae]|uniref:uncharacterized protein n=1 Tax=Alternaria ventricosa TaxID=1187951 RepID=UPI0020C570D7|nr:uncharacterized protein J4E93_006989 [Alternaria ventricosa]XP_049211260.1 uncharacterized protein J4E79_005517 [Alternaria viburni]XP_049221033.1 uncharacterized protein J4E78_006676 [Alternaria triticimaculans]XP_049232298.1 uncharacterized protein J4E87_006501 [Alternaria ethzedia]XP_049243375.1 uncharacterized protein J4E84_006512 [Alternaria hordeiaustralica]XP_049256783.1 uncharacterized protein J4E88_003747 [Alternaria novae-zelandiae]XP_051288474.1 uncharacterized protein J4E90_008